MDLNTVVGIDYYSLFALLAIAFVIGFSMGKRVARMGFMFLLFLTVIIYFVFFADTGGAAA